MNSRIYDPLTETPGTLETLQPLADSLSQVEGFLRRYIVFPSRAHSPAIALWVAHSHALSAFDYTPYLHISSPEKRCGKSRVLDALALLVPQPWAAISPSDAVIYRKIEAKKPTLLLDEVDTIFKKGGKDENKEGLRALLNAGFNRSATVPRCTGKNHEIVDFPVFCAKVIAGIGKLPDTVADRSVPIVLARKTRSEAVERFRRREAEERAQPIHGALSAWARRGLTLDELRNARPEMPDRLGDRQADICEPLLAIADAAGESWPERGRTALVELLTDCEDDAESEGEKLLAAIRRTFASGGATRLSTEQLLNALVEEEDGPWVEWWERDLNSGNRQGPASKLARILRPYGIRSRTHRLSNGATLKGYAVEDFTNVWERYLDTVPEP
jgi:hypothetical protein